MARGKKKRTYRRFNGLACSEKTHDALVYVSLSYGGNVNTTEFMDKSWDWYTGCIAKQTYRGLFKKIELDKLPVLRMATIASECYRLYHKRIEHFRQFVTQPIANKIFLDLSKEVKSNE